MIANCSDIPTLLLVDNLHPSTPLDNLDITSYRMSTSSGRPVDPRVPRRWTPRFLLLPRSWPRTSHDRAAPMTLFRPASLPLPRQRLFLRRSSGGSPFDFQLHRASLFFSLCRAFHIHNRSYQSYFICPTIYWPERFLIETTDVS